MKQNQQMQKKEKAFTWKEMQGKKAKVSLSTGNLKLKSDDVTRFIIWNLPAEETCPFATPHCKACCYAKKAEKNYPGCLPAREKNLAFSKSAEFVPFMIKAIHDISSKPAYKKAQHITVRIHESGDYYNYGYLIAWLKIAMACTDIPNIDFASYTKSTPYLKKAKAAGYDIKKYIRFNSSLWDDTEPERIEETIEMDLPIYTAYETRAMFPKDFAECKCDNCSHCRKCFHGEKAEKKVAVVIH